MTRQGLVDSAQGTTSISGTVTVQETVHNLSVAEGEVSVTGATTVIATPGAGVNLVLSSMLIQNVSAVATTAQVVDGNGNVTAEHLLQTQGAGLSVAFPVAREWRCPDNTPLSISLSAANLHRYTIYYYTE